MERGSGRRLLLAAEARAMREAKATIPIPVDEREKRNFANDPDSLETLHGRREQRTRQVANGEPTYADRLSDGNAVIGMGGDE